MGLSVHLDLAMKFLALALIVASASAKNLRFNLLAPPTELEYGFCDGSPEPLAFDVMSVTPFPILVQNGATITLEIQITLNQEVPVGSVVDLNLVLEGLIPIKIPCLEIEGLHIGSCPSPWNWSVWWWRPLDRWTHRVHSRHPVALPQGHREGRGDRHRRLWQPVRLHLRQGCRRPLNLSIS